MLASDARRASACRSPYGHRRTDRSARLLPRRGRSVPSAASRASLAHAGGVKNDWLDVRPSNLREQRGRHPVERQCPRPRLPRPAMDCRTPQIDRLRLTPKRIEAIAVALEEVAALPDPVGEVIESSVRPNGLEVAEGARAAGRRVLHLRVAAERHGRRRGDLRQERQRGDPARRQGSGPLAAGRSSRCCTRRADECGLPADAVQLVETTDRAAVGHFLALPEYIDVAIPRGGESLIRRVAAEATDAGDQALHRQLPRVRRCGGRSGHGRADHDQRQVPAAGRLQRGRVAAGARRRRRRVPAADRRGARERTASRCAATTRRASWCPAAKPATEEDYAAEFLGPIISVQGRRLARRGDRAHQPLRLAAHRRDRHRRPGGGPASSRARVDSAAVMVNASTRFNDGVRVRPGGRDRHQHRQVPRPRPLRAEGADEVQVRGVWETGK